MGLLTWKYKVTGFRRAGLKTEAAHGQGSSTWQHEWIDFKSCSKREAVFGQGLIYMAV